MLLISQLLLYCCCLVAKLCPTLCHLMDCSTPGSSVLHYLHSLLKFMSIEPMMLSNYHPLPPTSHFVFTLSQHQSLFQWVGSSHQVAKVFELQHQFFKWVSLQLTDWISLQSKGLSRVFANTTIQKHQFFSTQLSSWPTEGKNPDNLILDFRPLVLPRWR